MTAEFFALAFAAAINPSLLGTDLMLIVNRRPVAMLAFVLTGGLGMAVTIGLVDVLVVRSQLVKTQGGIGAAGDLAIGLLMTAIGGLIIARRRPGARTAKSPAHDKKQRGDSWMQRALAQPRLALAVAVGAVLGLPGGLYLTALHNLVAGHWSTATQVIAVLVFAVIEFTLVIVPLALLISRPQDTAAVLHRAQDWLARNGRMTLAVLLCGLGIYLTISSIVSLIG
ncbi:MAG TPA: GAP family protein [Streptosporangiaceae bacterium]|nr:GAP family protein [Streptosporangiaceae bacterium]